MEGGVEGGGEGERWWRGGGEVEERGRNASCNEFETEKMFRAMRSHTIGTLIKTNPIIPDTQQTAYSQQWGGASPVHSPTGAYQQEQQYGQYGGGKGSQHSAYPQPPDTDTQVSCHPLTVMITLRSC